MLGPQLGITKQAAGQLVSELERRGYVRRQTVASDARAKEVTLTDWGIDCLRVSAVLLEEIRAEWAAEVPAGRLDETAAALSGLGRALGRPGALRPVF